MSMRLLQAVGGLRGGCGMIDRIIELILQCFVRQTHYVRRDLESRVVCDIGAMVRTSVYTRYSTERTSKQRGVVEKRAERRKWKQIFVIYV